MDFITNKYRKVCGMLKFLLLFCLLFPGKVFSVSNNVPLRIACIGNSVTYGFGLHDRETECYPSQLQKILGSNFVVANFGMNGATLLSKGHRPYIQSEAYRKALAYKPDIVVIDLGWNDTDPRNWPSYRDEFTMAHDPNLRLMNFKEIATTADVKWDSLTLEKVNRLNYFEGAWAKCSPKEAASFSAIAYHFGKELRERLNIPVGLIEVAVGGAPAEAFIDRYSLEHHPQLVNVLSNWSTNDFIMEWCRERALVNIANSKNPLQRHPYMPAYVFEAGISEFRGFPVKGILWYQGESNAHNMEHHEVVFPELIRSWRHFWENDKMPFLFAQLSSIQRPGWEIFRDSQRRMAGGIPNCFMAVTSDLGDSLNVHPIRKQEVGHRLALQALQKVYGQKVLADGSLIQADGPLPLKASRVGKSGLEIFFSTNQKLQTSDHKSLRELEAAGSDAVFHPITGEIKDNRIVIKTDLQDISQVRYAWRPYTSGNLVNKEGLPASTFRLNVK